MDAGSCILMGDCRRGRGLLERWAGLLCQRLVICSPFFTGRRTPEVCQHSTVMSFEMDRVGSQLIPPLPSVEARRSGVPERETNSNSRSLQSALHASILRSTSNGGGGGVGIVIITCQLCVPAVPFPRTAPIRTS